MPKSTATTTPPASPVEPTTATHPPAARTPRTGGHLRLVPPDAAASPSDGGADSHPQVAQVLDHARGLIEAFLEHRTAAGRDPNTVRCERTTVTKFCFWLATGRLPAAGYRGKLSFEAAAPQPGWTPLRPEDTDARLVVKYRDALCAGGVSEASRYRDVLQLGHFFRWLTGTNDNPVTEAKKNVRHRTVPTDTHARHDSFYTAEDTATMLRASAELTAATRGRCDDDDAVARREWLSAEVGHLVLLWLWGTGASAAAICSLRVSDLDLEAGTVTWRKSDAEPGSDQAPDTVTQPLPAALVAAVADYLTRVRPQLRITDDRLIVNPAAQSKGRDYLPREVQRLTKRIAEAADLGDEPGGHSPGRWAKTYAQRILDSDRGSLVTLLWLHGRRAWVGLERTYGVAKSATSSVSIDSVYPSGAEQTRPLPDRRPNIPAAV